MRIPKKTLVKRLVAQKKYKEALQICKEWNYSDPSYQSILRLGYESLMYPNFYKQLGHDPEHNYEEAIKVLHIVYGS